eukprot:109726-Chlamydomonas_euryale.AAC.4
MQCKQGHVGDVDGRETIRLKWTRSTFVSCTTASSYQQWTSSLGHAVTMFGHGARWLMDSMVWDRRSRAQQAYWSICPLALPVTLIATLLDTVPVTLTQSHRDRDSHTKSPVTATVILTQSHRDCDSHTETQLQGQSGSWGVQTDIGHTSGRAIRVRFTEYRKSTRDCSTGSRPTRGMPVLSAARQTEPAWKEDLQGRHARHEQQS